MLYNPKRNLAFIHIPKNAGQAVRKALSEAEPISYASFAADMKVDEARAEALMEEGTAFPDIGLVQPEHLPLAFLKSHFPDSWQVLTGAKSFILVRTPRDRFLSALMQRLREYGGAGAIRADDPLVAREAHHVCTWLDGRGAFCDKEYIHFSRQVDYADCDGERIVSAIFPLDRTDAAAAWVEAETGLAIDVTHDHARREPKGWARSLQPAARFIGRNLMPLPLKRAIYPLWTKSAVFANASKRYKTVDLGADVERFIADYYAADAAMYEEASKSLA